MQQNCRLLTLPGELRNKIWALSLTHDDLPIGLSTADGPSKILLHTCQQIRSEAAGSIYSEADSQYWTAGRFEIHCDTAEIQVQKLSAERLKQISHLKVYGRSESYIFISGVWACTGLCQSALASDVIRPSSREHCPAKTVYRAGRSKSTTVKSHRTHCYCNDSCSDMSWPGCGKHSFVSLDKSADVEKAHQDFEWDGLTSDELVGVLRWYERSVRRRRAHMGSLWVDFDTDEWMQMPELN